MRRMLKSRLHDYALVCAVITGVCIGIVLEDPLTRAFRAAVTPAGAETTTLIGPASVIDGDTLEIRGTRIRLHGIDAPESGQTCITADGQSWRCGQGAALALSDRIGRAPVRCEQTDTDRYGRAIAVCYRGDEDLNAWMVRAGHAVAYRRYSSDYVGEEALARAGKRGLWAGTFERPWDWRRARR